MKHGYSSDEETRKLLAESINHANNKLLFQSISVAVWWVRIAIDAPKKAPL